MANGTENKATDPALIELLESRAQPAGKVEAAAVGAPATDPNLINQLELNAQPIMAGRPKTPQELIAAGESTIAPASSMREQLTNQFLKAQPDAPQFDFPELPLNIQTQEGIIPIQDELTFAGGNPLAQADIVEKRLGVEVEFDEVGRPYTEINGQNYYLNKPGLSMADVTHGILEGAMLAGGARLGGLMPGGMGVRAITSGVGAAGTAVGMEQVAEVLGSEQPPDLKRTAIIGLMTTAGEFGAPVAERLLRRVFTSRNLYKNGRLTPKGQKIFQKMGVDPAVATPEMARLFQQVERLGLPEEQLAQVLKAGTLPEPVPLTKGQITGAPAQQAREASMIGGARGEPAQQIMMARQQAQREAMARQAPAIQAEMARGGPIVTERGQAAQRVTEALRERFRESKQAVRVAYDKAKGRAFVPRETISDLSTGLKQGLAKEGFNIDAPEVSRMFKELEKYTPENVKGVNVNALETWRKGIGKARQSVITSDPSQAEALRIMKSSYDDMVDDALTQGLISGDEQVIGSLKKARELNKRHAELFKDNKVIEKLVKEDVTPEQAVDYVFGASRLGAKKESVQILRKMKEIFGEDSEQIRALQEEAFVRLMKRQPKDGFSAQKFITDLDNSLKDSPTLMKELFTEKQLATLKQMRDVAEITIPVPEAVNMSRTSYHAIRMLAEGFPGSNVISTAIGRFGRPFSDQYWKGQAIQATEAFVAPERLFTPGVVGAVAAEAEQIRERE